LNKKAIIIEDEFHEKQVELDIRDISNNKFVEAVDFKDYFIYDTDKELLFAVDWDDFFFLICSNKDNLDKVISTLNFEGFYCNEYTESAWELTKEELNAGLEKESGGKSNSLH